MDGTYTVTLVAARCGMQDTTEQVISVTPLGVTHENQSIGSWSIYPNPTQSAITVKINVAGNLFYKIFNTAGIEMLCGNIYKAETSIDVSNVPEGLYIIQVFNDKNESRGYQKIVKVDR